MAGVRFLDSISSMIYSEDRQEYRVRFYRNRKTGESSVLEYIKDLGKKDRAKVSKYIEFLRVHEGYLDEPYSKHIIGKIRELRVDFGHNRHRILYFTFIKRTIILLHAFLKKTTKTPVSEIMKAEENYKDVLANQKLYE
jgi:phage-related protein